MAQSVSLHSKRQRVVGFDFIKTIAILLVITIHMIYGSGLPHAWYTHLLSTLTMVCVPLFIMVNGALLLNKPFNSAKHKRKVIQLIVLTIIWKILLLIFCYYTLDYEVDLSKASILSYLLGGNPPYGNIGYVWFLNFYIGLMILFPIIKMIFDSRKGIKWLIAATLIYPIGGTLEMIYVPVANMLKINSSIEVFGHFDSMSPFSYVSSTLILIFLIGGIIWREHLSQQSNRKHAVRTKSRIINLVIKHPISSAIITGILCYAIMYAIVCYDNAFVNHDWWDVSERYANLFTVGLTSSLFYLLSIAKYPKPIARFSIFMGSRTFSIYIMHIAAMNGLTYLMCTGILPTIHGMPALIAPLYLLVLYLISEFLLAVIAWIIEHIPYAKVLLFK